MTITTAILPAAGPGQRLDRIGNPKPLVTVGGQPLLLRLLKQLSMHHIEHAIVILGHQASLLEAALNAWRPQLQLTLHTVRAPRWTLGCGHSLLAARELIEPSTPFVLSMADHLFDDPLLDTLLEVPHEGGQVHVLADFQTARVWDIGSAMKIQVEGTHVRAISRSLKSFQAIDAGLMTADPSLFDALAEAAADPRHQGALELSDGLSLLACKGRVHAVEMETGRWEDIDTPGALIHAEMRLRNDLRMGWLRKAPATAGEALPPVRRFEFTTGNLLRTEVELRRGAVCTPELAGLIRPESASSPIFVFSDETVFGIYGARFVARLREAGYDVRHVVMADGEVSKTLSSYAHLVERVLAQGIDERSVLISLGGGAVCNVCGFIAATLYRGLELVHVPTTLMAQCDAAISHKQGVNGARGKNLVGSYYAPRRIVVDVEVLRTLAPRWLRDGMAEIIKHALGQDASLIQTLLDHEGPLLDLDFLESLIARTIELKCALMSDDPYEHGAGMVLQYGHTVGHAVEFLSSFQFAHGESVAIGMMVAARVADRLGVAERGLVERHRSIIERFALPTTLPAHIPTRAILDTMRYNKRYLVEGTRMALVARPGQLVCIDNDYAIPVSEPVLERTLEDSRATCEPAVRQGTGL